MTGAFKPLVRGTPCTTAVVPFVDLETSFPVPTFCLFTTNWFDPNGSALFSAAILFRTVADIELIVEVCQIMWLLKAHNGIEWYWLRLRVNSFLVNPPLHSRKYIALDNIFLEPKG